jgi:putative transcriptional regulator
MTEEEIHQNALDDPDNPPLTPERLATMRRVPNAKKLRLQLGLTQEEFSRRFEIALGTLRDWEQGVRRPDSTAKAYLRVIERIPEAVQEALKSRTSEPTVTAGTTGADSENVRRPA